MCLGALSSRVARVVGLAAVLLVVMCVAASGVWGATGYVSVGSFGGSGGGGGLFSGPQHAAVDGASGDVFVADSANNLVQAFAPSGSAASFVTQISTLSDASSLASPFGVAIDQSVSPIAVYIADAGNNRIVKLVSDGAGVPSFSVDPSFTSPTLASYRAPLAVDPVSHDLLVADPGDSLVKRFTSTGAVGSPAAFDGAGAPGGTFGAFGAGVGGGLLDIAVTPSGQVVVVDGVIGQFSAAVTRVERFSAGGYGRRRLGWEDRVSLGRRSRLILRLGG